MRVAMVATISDEPSYSVEFAEMMSESCDVFLYISNKHFESWGQRPKRPGQRLETAWLPWPRQRDIRNVCFIESLSRRILHWNPDVIHFFYDTNIWLNLLRPLLRSIPVVTSVHDVRYHPGDTSSRRIPMFFKKNVSRQSNAIIVHGEQLKGDAENELPVRPDRIFVVPHLPPMHYAEMAKESKLLKPTDGKFRVLFFGRIYEYKGLQYLLEAAPLVRAKVPHIQFVIAGTGDDFSKYRAQIDDFACIDVRNRFIPDNEAARLYAEADLVVLPYIEASQSGVLMTAMACGLPVVATEVGDMAAVVRSTGMGLVVPPRDKLALASAIARVALDGNLQAELSRNAMKAMEGEYSRKTLSSRVTHVYEELVKN
jgi:glycosyltransferase involved in cell wall biosynthesis